MLKNQVGAHASSRPCMKSPMKDIEPSPCKVPCNIKPEIHPNSFHNIEKEHVLVIMLSFLTTTLCILIHCVQVSLNRFQDYDYVGQKQNKTKHTKQ